MIAQQVGICGMLHPRRCRTFTSHLKATLRSASHPSRFCPISPSVGNLWEKLADSDESRGILGYLAE